MSRFDFVPATASDAGFSAAGLAELDAYYDTLVAKGELPGHVMLLARGDKLVRGHVTGYADWESKAPLAPDSIFTLYSMTKPLAAAAMLFLYEEGKWQLDDPVAMHLPEFAGVEALAGSGATRGPTLRETFTHSAGFSFGSTPEEMMANLEKLSWHKARSLSELIGRYAELPLSYEPGSAWAYSFATDIHAEIVERLSGQRFDLFLQQRLFDPLGMVDTRFALDHHQARRLVQGHVYDEATGRLRGAVAAERMEAIFPMGGTSLKTTAIDYARFARMLLGRGTLGDATIYRPETVDMMLANHLPDHFREKDFPILHYRIGGGNGHGLNGMVCIDPEQAGRPVGKGTYEWGGAFGTWFWIDPENDILCIGLTNRKRRPTELRPPEIVAQELVYRALQR